jgi:hypothetical protein
VKRFLVDTSVIVDVLVRDRVWFDWSASTLERCEDKVCQPGLEPATSLPLGLDERGQRVGLRARYSAPGSSPPTSANASRTR